MPSVALAYQKERHAEGLAAAIGEGPFSYDVDVLDSDGIGLYRALRAGNYDLVQTDEALRKGGVAALATRGSDTALTLDIQGWADYLNSHGKHGLLVSGGISAVASAVFRQADGVVFVSRATKRELEDSFEFDEWRYAMPVFDVPRYSQLGNNTESEFAGEILTVTNLRYESKLAGVRTVLDAVEPLLEQYDCVYRIAGSGRYLPDLRAHIQDCEHAERIEVLGYREDVPDLLESADLFVYVSEIDSLGMVVLEAQAAGLPVVAGDVGGIPEAVGDAGVVCPPTAGPVRAVVRTLVTSPTLRETLAIQAEDRMERYAARQAVRHVELWETTLD